MDIKAPIRISEELAFQCPSIKLPCLRCDAINLQDWLSKANALIRLCDCLFNAQSNVFWSSVVLNPQILNELDHALINLPFFGDFQEGGTFAHVLELAPVTSELYAKVWIVFLRLTANFEAEGVNSATYRNFVQQNSILTLRRLRLYSGLFAEQYFQPFKKIINRLKQTVPTLFDQFKNEASSFLNDINLIHESVASMNYRGLSGEVRQFNAVFEFYEFMQKQTREIVGWCELFRMMTDLRPTNELLKAIPALVEDVNESLEDHVLVNLAVGSNQLLIGLCRSITHLKQVLTKLYIKFYENYADEIDKINLLAILIDNHELLVRVADKLNEQIGTLFQRSKLKDIVAKIRAAIEQANAKKAREIIENLREQGLLKNLGVINDKDIEDKVEMLMSILPYSKEFVHLVLRFYGYNQEIALANMLEPESLPFQLRILIKDTSILPNAEPTRTSILRLDDVYQDSDNDSEPENGTSGDPKTVGEQDLLALLTAPLKSSPSDNAKSKLTPREQKLKQTEERLNRLLEKSTDTLNMSKLHFLVEAMQQKQNKEEKTVEIDGKTFTKFYKDDPDEVNKKDKEILRSKLNAHKYEQEEEDEEYARFKMEKKFEEDIGQTGRFNRGYTGVKIQDMYDDEFNDGLDEQPFGLSEGLTTDEKGAGETKYAKPIGPLGLPSGLTFNQKGRVPKKGQKYPQQPVEPQQQTSTSGTSTKKPAANVQQKAGVKQQQPQKPQKQNSDEKASSDAPAQEKRKDGYTGGKQRMRKEQHKNQHKQRGADRKMQRANPF